MFPKFFRTRAVTIRTRPFLLVACLLLGLSFVPILRSGAARLVSRVAPGVERGAGGKRMVGAPASPFFVPAMTATKTGVLGVTPGDDVNGNGRINRGDTLLYTVIINNSGTDATGVNFSDTIDTNTTLVMGSFSASPVATDDALPVTVTGNVSINSANLAVPFSVASNDYLGANPLATITAFDATSAQGGNVSMTTSGAGLGQFTYDPPAGYEGTDTFTYTLSDNPAASSAVANRKATVTITVSGMVWFISNNATGCVVAGCGRLSNPFSTLAAFSTLNNGTGNNPAANDNIFIYESATQYTGAVILLSGQKLIGQDATASLSTLTGLTTPTGSPTFPAMNSGNGTVTNIGSTVTLNTNALVRGLQINSTTSTGMNDPAGAITGVNVSEVSITTTSGAAISLSSLGGTLTFPSITTSGAAPNGISLTSVTGSFTVSGNTSIVGTTGTGVNLSSDSATITFGDLDIDTATNVRAFQAASNTGAITTTSGTIADTGTAVAVEITGTSAATRTPLNVQFTSVSANGATKGIIVTNTSASGSPGGFRVTGVDGGDADTLPDAGTGGTIQNTTQRGADINTASGAIFLGGMNFLNAATTQTVTGVNCGSALPTTDNNLNCTAAIHLVSTTGGVTLNTILIDGSVQGGINGNGVVDLVMNGVEVRNVGNEIDENGVTLKNLTGTGSITNGNFHDNEARQLFIINTAGTLSSFNISGSNFANAPAPNGGQGVLLQSHNAGTTMTVSVASSTFSNLFTNAHQVAASSGSTQNVTLTGSTFTNNNAATVIQSSAGANVNYSVQNNNSVTGALSGSNAINIKTDGGSNGSGNITGNTIGSGAVGSGAVCGGGCNGIFINQRNGGTLNANVVGNTIRHVDSSGISASGGQDSSFGAGKFNITITGNLISDPDGAAPAQGILVLGGIISGDVNCVTATVGGTVVPGAYPSTTANAKNRITGSWDPPPMSLGNEILLVKSIATSTFNLPGQSGGSTAWITARNEITDATGVSVTTSGTTGTLSVCPGSAPRQINLSGASLDGEMAQVLSSGAGACGKSFSRSLINLKVGWNPLTSADGEAFDVAAEKRVSGPNLSANLVEATPGPTQNSSSWAGLVSEIVGRINAALDPTTFAQRANPNPPVRSADVKRPESGETVSAAIGNLPAGKSVTIVFKATLSLSLGYNSVSNQGTVSGSNFANVLTDDPGVVGAANATVNQISAADLTAVKTNNASGTRPLNTAWNWTIAVTNGGTEDAVFTNGQLVFSDSLPDANITYGLPTTNNANVVCSISGTFDLTCTASGTATIAGPAGTFNITVPVTGASVAGAYANPRAGGGGCTVDPSSLIDEGANEGNNTCSNTVNVFTPPTVVKSFLPTAVAPGGISTLSIQITNPAANPAPLTGIAFTDTFPAGLQVAGSPLATNTCNGTFAPGAGNTSITLGASSLNAGASCTVTVKVTPTTGGAKINNVTVASTQGGNAAVASATLTVGKAPLDFDGDGTTDYAVVRDSGAPRPGGLDSGTMDIPDNQIPDPDPNATAAHPQRGYYFRRPGVRFDPLSPSLDRAATAMANLIRWSINTSGPGADITKDFGTLADFPVPADYDGDGICDIAVWTGGVTAKFRVLTSASNFTTFVEYTLGNATSDPSVVGDYDGDGKADPAILNATTGQWTYLGGATHTVSTTVTPIGTFGGGFPAPGDYDGDGKFDFMLETRDGVNPTMGHFYQWNNTGSTTPPATTNFAFGNYRDVVIPGDYDGDGKTDLCLASLIVNPVAWRIRLTNGGTLLGPFNLGNPLMDYTITGDYNGDQKAELTIFHPPATTQFDSLLAPPFTSHLTANFGLSGDYPVAYFNAH